MEIRGDINALIEYLKAEDDREVLKHALTDWRNRDRSVYYDKGWRACSQMHLIANSCRKKRINSVINIKDGMISAVSILDFYESIQKELQNFIKFGNELERLTANNIIILIDNRLGDIKFKNKSTTEKEFVRFFIWLQDELKMMTNYDESDEYDSDPVKNVVISVLAYMDNLLGNLEPDRRILFSKDKE